MNIMNNYIRRIKMKPTEYKDIKKIIDIMAQSPELNDDEFRQYKKLVIRMCEISQKYMEGK